MTIFVSGGCKNGKSTYAQRLAKSLEAKSHSPLYYIATMDPHDDEDNARIARHLRERAGWGFETLEQPRDLCALLGKTGGAGVYMLDSVTALVANEMFPYPEIDLAAGERVAGDIKRFLASVQDAVLVSDFIYSGDGCYEGLTDDYLRALALCDRTAAKYCDCVLEVACGNVICHKGAAPCI